jgi:hypothetical protein
MSVGFETFARSADMLLGKSKKNISGRINIATSANMTLAKALMSILQINSVADRRGRFNAKTLGPSCQSPFSRQHRVPAQVTVEIRWDEKAGLRTGCGVRSQVIDVLKAQIKMRPAMKKVSTRAAAQSRNIHSRD